MMPSTDTARDVIDTPVAPQAIHDAATAPPSRPYRSHKVPACERCRVRKLRCTVDLKDRPCLLCRLNNAKCSRAEGEGGSSSAASSAATGVAADNGASGAADSELGSLSTPPSLDSSNAKASSNARARKRQRRGGSAGVQVQDPGRRHTREALSSGPHPLSGSHHDGDDRDVCPRGSSFTIVGPESAEDLQVIEKYISVQPADSKRRLFNLVSSDLSNPIVSLSVPRYREGMAQTRMPGKAQLEILEQLFGPFKSELIDLYFRKLHPAFPVVDEAAILAAKPSGARVLWPALLCDILASCMIYWDSSPILRKHPRPDIKYVWNQAVSAVHDDFQAPSMATVYAAILDLGGRPTTTITGNTVSSGRLVALAHSLGLNRDPTKWDISDHEKKLRVRLWWGVLIHDRWSSLAHGVPPSILRTQYDVPIPTKATLLTSGIDPTVDDRDRAADGFIALCTLSEILGEVLPLLHDIRKVDRDTSGRRSDLESDLEKWMTSLPDFLRHPVRNENRAFPVSGSSSLWLGFLAVRMLLCRINLHELPRSNNARDIEEKHQYLSKLRRSADAIIDFVCSLDELNLQEFWLPYTGYHLASATFLLLRCAIECDPETASSCRSSVERLRTWLSEAKEKHGWDCGDICLAQSEGSVSKLLAAYQQQHRREEQRRESVNWERSPEVNSLPEPQQPTPSSGRAVETRASSRVATPQPGTHYPVAHEAGETPVPPQVGEIALNPSQQQQAVAMGWETAMAPQTLPSYNTIDPLGYPWADLWDMFNIDGTVIN